VSSKDWPGARTANLEASPDLRASSGELEHRSQSADKRLPDNVILLFDLDSSECGSASSSLDRERVRAPVAEHSARVLQQLDSFRTGVGKRRLDCEVINIGDGLRPRDSELERRSGCDARGERSNESRGGRAHFEVSE
jgi:hypothetical protein